MFEINEKLIAENRALIALAPSKTDVDRNLKDGTVVYTHDTTNLYYVVPTSRGGLRRILSEDDLSFIKDIINSNDDYTSARVNSVPNTTVVRDDKGYIYVDSIVIDNNIKIKYNTALNKLEIVTYSNLDEPKNYNHDGYVISTGNYPSTITLRDSTGCVFGSKFIIGNKASLNFDSGNFLIKTDSELVEDYKKGLINGIEVNISAKDNTVALRDSLGNINCNGIVISNKVLIKYNQTNNNVDFLSGTFIPNEIEVEVSESDKCSIASKSHTAPIRSSYSDIYCDSIVLKDAIQIMYNIGSDEFIIRDYQNYSKDTTIITDDLIVGQCESVPNTIPLRDTYGAIHVDGIIFKNKYLLTYDPLTKDVKAELFNDIITDNKGTYFSNSYSISSTAFNVVIRDNKSYIHIDGVIFSETAKFTLDSNLDFIVMKGDYKIKSVEEDITSLKQSLKEHENTTASAFKKAHVYIEDTLNSNNSETTLSTLGLNKVLRDLLINESCSVKKSNLIFNSFRTIDYVDKNDIKKKTIEYSLEEYPTSKKIIYYDNTGVNIAEEILYTLEYEILTDGSKILKNELRV